MNRESQRHSARCCHVVAILVSLAALLALLAWHIAQYAFVCDDAFISFRYARNLANGHGLVFNPGFERVEGYTNFLWVLLLACVQLVGVKPEVAANPLSIGCAVALVLCLTRFCWRECRTAAQCWLALVPALILATNRSFAAWCTSGLETSLFDLLIVAAILCSIAEMRIRFGTPGGSWSFPWSSVFFALATLTRPEGLLIAVAVVSVRAVIERLSGTLRPRTLVRGAVAYGLIVGGHVLFRVLYYHEWLPNTYYAKIGTPWWEMGAAYLACFALEYGLALWAPVLAVALLARGCRRRLAAPALIAAAIVPHAVYVARIGGDHFEYRPLVYYFPLLAILWFHALQYAAHKSVGAVVGVVYFLACLALGALLPWAAHAGFPAQYRPGFPGLAPRDDSSANLVESRYMPDWAGGYISNSYVSSLNALSRKLTIQLVAVRIEEHAAFCAETRRQAFWLRQLLEQGLLPADTHVALNCVGAIPYYTDFRTLDKQGLTDRRVARQPSASGERRLSAHEKLAPFSYACESGVDIWSIPPWQIVLPADHPALLFLAHVADTLPHPVWIADVSDDRRILAAAPAGIESLAKRMPRLKFQPIQRAIVMDRERFARGFTPTSPDLQVGEPYDMMYTRQGQSLIQRGDRRAARIHLERAIATNPANQHAAELLKSLGR